MTTYSVRCRNGYCRHRRVIKCHPDEYRIVPKCPSCGQRKGWRLENRDYNRKDLCGCSQVPLYPHRKGKHKYCDFHPFGYYNQAKRAGIEDESIPLEYLGRKMRHDEPVPF